MVSESLVFLKNILYLEVIQILPLEVYSARNLLLYVVCLWDTGKKKTTQNTY